MQGDRGPMRTTLLVLAALALGLGGCAETQLTAQNAKNHGSRQGAGAGYKVGRPYQVNGEWYRPAVDYDYSRVGLASWYGPKFHGKHTANGERFDMNALTAAHKTLPLPSVVRVTNLENGRSIKLRVNDRGPFVEDRIIDVSRRAAQLLGFKKKGVARVRVEVVAEDSQRLASRSGAGGRPPPRRPPPATRKTVYASALPPAPLPAGAGSSSAPLAAAALERKEVGQGAAPPPAVAAVDRVPLAASARPARTLPAGARPSGKRVYVQAGAFSYYPNAIQVRAHLMGLGPVNISPVRREGRDLYRVRVGPLNSPQEADRIQTAVAGAGFPEARVVVD